MKKLKDFLHELVKQPVIKVEEKTIEQRVIVKDLPVSKADILTIDLNSKITDRMLSRRGIF
jgi:hypothetical protein